MKPLTGYIALGVLVVAALAYGSHQLGQAREARGEARELQRQVAEDSVRIEALEDSLVAVDAWAADSIARLDEAREEAERREAQARAAIEAARERVDAASSAVDALALPDSVRTLIEAERAEREAEVQALISQVGALEDQLATADQTVRIQARQIEARDDLIRELREGIETARAESDAWERAASPGFFARITRSVPALLLGAGVVLLL